MIAKAYLKRKCHQGSAFLFKKDVFAFLSKVAGF